MRFSTKISAALVVFLSLYTGTFDAEAASSTPQQTSPGIAILASSSLTDVMTELVRIYSRRTGETASAFFESPEVLTDMILNGESADVYVSEHQQWLTKLKQQGLIDVYTISNLVKNQLVLVAPPDSLLRKNITPDMTLNAIIKDISDKTILVIPDTTTEPAGIEAMKSLMKLGYWDKIKSFMLRAETDRNALYLVAKGKNAGIVYYSDAYRNPEVAILSVFPENLHDPITYQGAVLAGLNMPKARKFLEFLKTPEAIEIFNKYGFIPN